MNRNSGLYLGREDTDELGIQERDDDAYDVFVKVKRNNTSCYSCYYFVIYRLRHQATAFSVAEKSFARPPTPSLGRFPFPPKPTNNCTKTAHETRDTHPSISLAHLERPHVEIEAEPIRLEFPTLHLPSRQKSSRHSFHAFITKPTTPKPKLPALTKKHLPSSDPNSCKTAPPTNRSTKIKSKFLPSTAQSWNHSPTFRENLPKWQRPTISIQSPTSTYCGFDVDEDPRPLSPVPTTGLPCITTLISHLQTNFDPSLCVFEAICPPLKLLSTRVGSFWRASLRRFLVFRRLFRPLKSGTSKSSCTFSVTRTEE